MTKDEKIKARELRAVAESIAPDSILARVLCRAADALEAAVEADKAHRQHADRFGRIFDTLCNLVAVGSVDAARTMVEELESGRIVDARHLKAVPGGLVASGWAVECVADALVDHLTTMGAENLAEWKLTMPDGRKVVLTAQWQGKKTPMDLVTEATQRAEKAEARVAELEAAAKLAEPVLILDAIRNGRVGRSTCAGCGVVWTEDSNGNCLTCGHPDADGHDRAACVVCRP